MSLDRLVDLARRITDDRGLPARPGPEHDIELKPPPGHVICCCARKVIPVQEVKHAHSGVVACTDSICDACVKDRPTHARIVCVTCHAVVGRLEPHRDRGSGFHFKAGAFYHVKDCPNCNPRLRDPQPGERQSSTLIEKEIFIRRKH